METMCQQDPSFGKVVDCKGIFSRYIFDNMLALNIHKQPMETIGKLLVELLEMLSKKNMMGLLVYTSHVRSNLISS